MTTWTANMKAAEIARQGELIKRRECPMAVVDYGLGWRKTGAGARYGVRDLNHVSLYRLEAVAYNPAAIETLQDHAEDLAGDHA